MACECRNGLEQGCPETTRAASLDYSIAEGIELLDGMDNAVLGDILSSSRPKSFKRGTAIYSQGDEAKMYFIILHGRIKIAQVGSNGSQTVIRILGRGDPFGCAAVLGRPHYPCSASAVVDSLVLAWDVATAQELLARYPVLGSNALGLFLGRLEEAHERMRELSSDRVEQRVAYALLRLCRQAGLRGVEGVTIDFPIGRQDLAEMTGTTLHTVSRILSRWEQSAIVKSGRRRILIRDTDALETISQAN